MARDKDSPSPKPEEVANHYASGYEADRLHTRAGKLDCERSRELLKRFLPPATATILDVGGACSLSWNTETVDVVLLFKPLYHLTDKRDRLRCYRKRVVYSDRVAFFSRWAYKSKDAIEIVERDSRLWKNDRFFRLQD